MPIEINIHQTCSDHHIAFVSTDEHCASGYGNEEARDAWLNTPKDSPENIKKRAHLKWLSLLSAVENALKDALKEGHITQDEYERELARWISDNPDPDQEGEPIQVDFGASIPVKIPVRVENE